MSGDFEYRMAEARDSASVTDLFRRADVPCFCQYYQFDGDHRDWQNRCANSREESAAELAEQLQSAQLSAVVALASGQVVGWARFAAPSALHKLYDGRLYRGLPCFTGDREKVRTVACFLVDPKYRRQGLARVLLSECIARAKAEGATAIEAFPRGATDVTDEEQWLGPKSLYIELGFAMVHDFAPYPVMRLSLD